MEITRVEQLPCGEVVDKLRSVSLRGYGGVRPYADADVRFVSDFDTDSVLPAQNYVLRSGVESVLTLRRELAAWNIDPFAMNGGVLIWTDGEPLRPRTLLPPIIEQSLEPNGELVDLVSDGMHRIFAARAAGLRVSVIRISGVSSPYYAFPITGGWTEVHVLDELAAGYQKKRYREPDDYKALFRDYNEVFPGIQLPRARAGAAQLEQG